MSAAEEAGISPLWQEWGRITRFLESARIAMNRERHLWSTLEFEGTDAVRLQTKSGTGTYTVRVDQHIAAMDDEETLLASVLIHSYALSESAVLDHLQLDPRSVGGIEDWGQRALDAVGRPWSEVKDGLAGAVETAVLRNAFAHASRDVSESIERRLNRAGSSAFAEGDQISLSYADVRECRARLRSLLRVSLIGGAS